MSSQQRVKVDVNTCSQFASAEGGRNMPTLIMYRYKDRVTRYQSRRVIYSPTTVYEGSTVCHLPHILGSCRVDYAFKVILVYVI